MNIVIAMSSVWSPCTEEILMKRLPGVNVHFVTNKESFTLKKLLSYSPTYVFCPHWSHIIPEEIFTQFECVIFHMTDLPYGRGGSPLQNLIIRGYKKTKISALKCVKELDAGPIYMKRDLDLSGSAFEIYKRATDIILDMIVDLIENRPEPIEQSGQPIVFERRKPEQSDISHINSTDSVYDYIRMLDAPGYPKAFLKNDHLKYEFMDAKKESDKIVCRVEIRYE